MLQSIHTVNDARLHFLAMIVQGKVLASPSRRRASQCSNTPHLSRAYLSRYSRVMRQIPNLLGTCSRPVGIGCLLC